MSELDQLNQSQAARRKNLAQWRASRLHEIELPSGLPVTVKDVTLQDLVMLDGVEIPNTLLDMMFENDSKQAAGDEDAQSDTDVILNMMRNKDEFNKLLNEMVKACLVEPKIGPVPDDDHITLAELTFGDKMHLFNFMNREVAAVRPFPAAPEPETDARGGGELQPTTEQPAEPGDGVGSLAA